jgi:hypothetical protein
MPRARLLLLLLACRPFPAGAETPLPNERIAHFLRTAPIVSADPVGKGVTETWRLTLDDGEIRHDASFQSIDERAAVKDLGGGRHETNFVDSYRYNIAAFRLAELVGLGDMVPVTVERTWQTKTGALSYWVDDVWMDENEMAERGLSPPDPSAWNLQIYKVRVFAQLVRDTDRNRGNTLITKGWRIWMIDFTRAFRRSPEVRSTEGLHHCARDVLRKLRELSREELDRALGETLSDNEIRGVLARRDRLVEHFDRLIRERGESAVLY